jgi:hypothetical protein
MASLEEEMESMMSSSRKKVDKYKKENPKATKPRSEDLQRAKENRARRARNRKFYLEEKERLSNLDRSRTRGPLHNN